jgi:aconitate hydratase
VALTSISALAYDRIEMGDVLKLRAIRRQIRESQQIEAENMTRRHVFFLNHELSGRQVDVLLAGGLINWMREELVAGGPGLSGSESSLGGD